MTRVLVVDDQDMVRQGLRLILELGGVEVVAEAKDGAEAVAAVAEHGPDVVLMDLRMPGMDGVEATRRIVGGSDARVLALTTFDVDRTWWTRSGPVRWASCSRTSPPRVSSRRYAGRRTVSRWSPRPSWPG